MSFSKIYIVIYDKLEYEEYKNFFYNHPVLEILYGNIFNYKADAFITAGNSFGLMDGGIDGHVNYFFDHIENRVQRKIMSDWKGELPVGVSIVFHVSGNNNYKYLCYSPTMRTPGPIPDSYNAYLAFRGALIECSKYSEISTIILPLLCRGVGCMKIEKILKQFQLAYDSFNQPIPRDWFRINDQTTKLMTFTSNQSS